jgi:hypothetical protein
VPSRSFHLPDTTPDGRPVWGGDSLRRGGAQYLATSGVDVWRIQALARHSSSAIIGYIESLHAQQLGNLAAEATLGRDIKNRCAAFALPSPPSVGKPLNTHHPSRCLQPPTPPPAPPTMPPLSDFPSVLSARTGGRVHVRSKMRTRRGWAWTRHEHAVLLADTDAGLRCLRCARAVCTSLPSSSSESSTSSG